MSDKITIIRGDDYSMSTHFTNADGTDYDLTGATVFFTVKSVDNLNDADDTNALIEKEITVHSNPTGGITMLVLSNTDTAITPGCYTYDLQIKTAGSEIHSAIRGVFEVVVDVTKRVVV